MPHHHTTDFQVRIFDVDGWGELPVSTLASYLEEAARAASTALGFGDAWYRTQGAAWIVRRLTLARYAPVRYGDAVTVETWVSDVRRVRAYRDYALRGADGRLLAGGRGDWVFFDRARNAPRGIDRGITDIMQPGDPLPLAAPSPADPLAAPAPAFSASRRVYRYEADSMGHVNNAVYLAWLDEALAEAATAAGVPLAAPGGAGPRLDGTWYEVDYLRSALPGDDLLIRSQLTGHAAGGAELAWQQEITRAADGDVLVRCVSRQALRGLGAAGLDTEAVVRALTAP